jgi:hypothetical protein
MTTKKTRKNYTSPAGEIKFANLQKPSTTFNADGVYDLQLLLTKEAAAPFIKQIKEWTAEAKTELLKEDPKIKTYKEYFPFGDDVDQEGNETGFVVFRFKQNATYKRDGETRNVKIDLFDAKGKPFPADKKIGRGSTVKAAFRVRSIKITTNKQYGVQLSLSAAQVLDLKEWAGRDAKGYGFGEEEGFSADDEASSSLETAGTDTEEGDL